MVCKQMTHINCFSYDGFCTVERTSVAAGRSGAFILLWIILVCILAKHNSMLVIDNWAMI